MTMTATATPAADTGLPKQVPPPTEWTEAGVMAVETAFS